MSVTNVTDGAILRDRIISMGFTIKGFAKRLSEKTKDVNGYAISEFTLSRALHSARGGRAEQWVRDRCAEELNYLEARL